MSLRAIRGARRADRRPPSRGGAHNEAPALLREADEDAWDQAFVELHHAVASAERNEIR